MEKPEPSGRYPRRKQQLRGAALKNKMQAEQKEQEQKAKLQQIREQQLQSLEKMKQTIKPKLEATPEEMDHYYNTHQLDEYGAPIPSVEHVTDSDDELGIAEEAFEIDEENSDKRVVQRSQKYPWEAIEKAFVEGMPDESGAWHYPTIFDLRTMFGVSYVQARKRIAQGKWVQKRDQWRQQLQAQIKAQSITNLIEAANKFDDQCIEVAQRGLSEVLDHFYAAQAEGETLSSGELDRLGRAAMSWQKVGRLALGLSTENTESRVETRNADPFATLDLSNLSNDQIEQLKTLLHQTEKNTVDSSLAK